MQGIIHISIKEEVLMKRIFLMIISLFLLTIPLGCGKKTGSSVYLGDYSTGEDQLVELKKEDGEKLLKEIENAKTVQLSMPEEGEIGTIPYYHLKTVDGSGETKEYYLYYSGSAGRIMKDGEKFFEEPFLIAFDILFHRIVFQNFATLTSVLGTSVSFPTVARAVPTAAESVTSEEAERVVTIVNTGKSRYGTDGRPRASLYC